MYGWDTLVILQHLLDDGLSKTAIAQRLGVSRRGSRLDPFTPIIAVRLATYPELSAVRLFDEVRAADYPGGITQVRDHVARVRPRPEPEPVVRFETAPGHQAQVDCAEFRLPWGKRYALVVVLGSSRLLWLKCYPRQTLATVIAGLEEAFAYFGGVPTELRFDQMKAVIIDDQRAEGGKLLEHPEFLRVAAHWDFRLRACRPYRAKTKGKVERPIRYLRDNFFSGRECIGDADLDAQRLHWLDGVANVRTHRTTQCVPRVRFETEEFPHLRPLVRPPARAARRTVAHLLAPAVPAVTVERRGLAAPAALDALLQAQIALRNHRRLDAAMRSSRLPAVKTLADFDFSFQPSIKREPLDSRHTLGFLERKENVICLGPPGVGKTHVAISLAIEAAESGRRVYYGTLGDLIMSLEEASQAGQLLHRMKTLSFPSLLIVDEIGYLPISRAGAMLFFQLMSRRYEQASTVLTSNKGFEEWGEIFGDDVMAAALIDRLVHHCHIVNIRGNSYRMRHHTDLHRALGTHRDAPTSDPPPRTRSRAKEAAAT